MSADLVEARVLNVKEMLKHHTLGPHDPLLPHLAGQTTYSFHGAKVSIGSARSGDALHPLYYA